MSKETGAVAVRPLAGVTDSDSKDIVEFDPAAFRAKRPEFAGLSDQVLQTAFEDAETLVANTPKATVPYRPRVKLLELATAHLLELGQRGGGAGVGAIASAAQGSTSVSFANLGQADRAGFWAQTSYGLLFWKASRPWRRFFYVPGCECRR